MGNASMQLTIPVDAIRNHRSISTVTESWFSPELKIMVASRTSDPRSAETIMRLENLSLLRAAREGAIFAGPVGTTPLIPVGGEWPSGGQD